MPTEMNESRIFDALDKFAIEIPSWGFANTGTRFGKFLQAGAATSIEEKFADALAIEFDDPFQLHIILPQEQRHLASIGCRPKRQVETAWPRRVVLKRFPFR